MGLERFGREMMIFFLFFFFGECVDVWGVGLVCFSFGEKANHSASRFGLVLGAAPTAGGRQGHAQPVSHGGDCPGSALPV